MKLCYLHNKTKNFSHHKDIFLERYPNNDIMKITSFIKTMDHNLYLVDLDYVDKKVSELVNTFFFGIENPLIYFFVPADYKISLIQLAFMVNAKSIITTTQDTNKVISKINSDFYKHQEYSKALELGSNIVNYHSYMIYKNKRFSYASKQLLRDLKCKTVKELRRKIDSNIDVKKFFMDDEAVKRFISTEISKDSVFFIKSIRSGEYTLISFELNNDYEAREDERNYISGRLTYLEFLKDKILEKIVSNKLLSMLTLDVYDIVYEFSQQHRELFIKNFLYEVELIIDSKLILAEYAPDMYVILFEDIDFIKMQKKSQNYYLQIINFLNKQDIDTDEEIDIDLYAINITGLELKPILKVLNSIEDKNVEYAHLNPNDVVYINDFQKKMKLKERINYLLNSIYENENENDLKLLNIYQGMSITTSSKILKKTKELLYVKVEEVQSYLIHFDQSVILQSSVLTKSIKANVKYICNKEKYAILHNFRMLDYNPTERLHGRVKSAKSILVAISLPGSRVKSELIDISAKSIALKVKKSKLMRNILNHEVELIFEIDDIMRKGSYIRIEENAVVVYESEPSEDGYVQLICIFQEDMKNEAAIINYIFNRQKTIIQNIKFLVK